MRRISIRRLAARFESLRYTSIWVLIVVPLLSMVFITASDESPLYTSLSRLAWVNGHRLFMFVWSLIVLFVMICLTLKVIRFSGLDEKRKRSLSALAIVNITISFVSGVFIPAKSGADVLNIWEYLHDRFTAIGWLSFGVALTVFSFSLRKVNKQQATIAISFMVFIWMTGAFAIFYVIDPETYCGSSAVAQVYIINMLNIFLLMNDVIQSLSKEETIDDTKRITQP